MQPRVLDVEDGIAGPRCLGFVRRDAGVHEAAGAAERSTEIDTRILSRGAAGRRLANCQSRISEMA